MVTILLESYLFPLFIYFLKKKGFKNYDFTLKVINLYDFPFSGSLLIRVYLLKLLIYIDLPIEIFLNALLSVENSEFVPVYLYTHFFTCQTKYIYGINRLGGVDSTQRKLGEVKWKPKPRISQGEIPSKVTM